ncbi:hypothetical protein KVT40_008259 [Elsinoe batatas]|uniref:Velvet domain-containing protein n=1 Tax=Elsinoe batatas TaxID=2601811 RepID=A0A8K0KVA3_9PEZI|nr:hypothetical protein KVT40_008259 [Elsinoe batatas]
MSMQTATHPSLPPFPHAAHPSPMDRPPMSAGSQQGMQVVLQSGIQSTGEPPKYNGTRGNYQFTLVIDQQPIRARMCGFGDKDRRPITPPPCVRVIVTDMTTGEEVPADEIDPSFFLLSVDLWDDSATQEKNIVRSSSNSPAVSISTATTTSFPVPPERPLYSAPPMYSGQGYGVPGAAPGYAQGGVYSQPQAHPGMYGQAAPGYPYQPGYPQGYGGQPPPGSPAYPQTSYGGAPVPYSPAAQQQSGMFTRNLIGSLTVNAFTLKDSDGKLGHWFILQDLSVRTEGSFRLKMSFMDIGTHASPVGKEENKINHGKTAVLSSVFSNAFQVYSAKKFPGVIESTPLSKCFAGQGIKIPIRKDAAKGGKDDDDED